VPPVGKNALHMAHQLKHARIAPQISADKPSWVKPPQPIAPEITHQRLSYEVAN
jgi:hypothetical protein